MVKMTRAFDQYGKIVSIDQVKNGLLCNCACIVCGTPLLARQGSRNAHHFSHLNQCHCDWTGETELHLLAKEVLLNDKHLSFTWLSLDGSPYDIGVHFCDVNQEVTFGSLRPDIVGTTTNGDIIFIEICVTHPCDVTKIVEYRRQSQNVIEVLLPKDLLINVDVLSVDFVRQAIERAEKKCLSFNPLSEFCKSMYKLNADLIKEQGSTLRQLRKDIATEYSKKRMLNNQISELERVSNSWSVKAQEVNERAKRYAQQLHDEIHAQNHIKKYLSDKAKYESLRSDLNAEYLKAVKKAESDIAKFETRLKQDVRNQIKLCESQRLKSIQDELLEFSGGTLLEVDQYIQKIKELYENRFDELERNWIVLERKLARFNEIDRRPEFVKPENRKLPPLNYYNKIRG